ncbi:MAG: hypothetical protein DMG58_37230, partial [Acidobacteria bacterium]
KSGVKRNNWGTNSFRRSKNLLHKPMILNTSGESSSKVGRPRAAGLNRRGTWLDPSVRGRLV